MMAEQLDVVVRFHDPARCRELERALFSLVGQRFRPLRVILATQRFTADEVAQVETAVRPVLSITGAPDLSVVNLEVPEPPDARSALANLGICQASGRYLAFLDYDDVVYPDAYRLLVERLQTSGHAVAFGGICIKMANVHASFLEITERRPRLPGRNTLDLLRQNFCPIHSFVVDRQRVRPDDLRFDPFLSKNEDYDFLLRLCAQSTADFGLLDTLVGEYVLKNDGSNTILTASAASDANRAGWAAAQAFMQARRETTIVSVEVQRSLGLSTVRAGMTVRELLDSRHARIT